VGPVLQERRDLPTEATVFIVTPGFTIVNPQGCTSGAFMIPDILSGNSTHDSTMGVLIRHFVCVDFTRDFPAISFIQDSTTIFIQDFITISFIQDSITMAFTGDSVTMAFIRVFIMEGSPAGSITDFAGNRLGFRIPESFRWL
jgi:hypothetical protein